MARRGQFQPGNRIGKTWQPGQSGNPTGLSALHRQWREAYANALVSTGSANGGLEVAAQNCARLVWKAAIAGESWATLHLVEVLGGPETSKIRLEVGRGQDEIDFSRLSDAELETLERILESARQPAQALADGAVPTEFEKVP
jgi:hypothetical protein